MKREVAAEIVDSLKEAGIDFVATLTEANLHDLVMALGEDTDIHHVPVTREEEGIGLRLVIGHDHIRFVLDVVRRLALDVELPQRREKAGGPSEP